jgi:hypothetical protein
MTSFKRIDYMSARQPGRESTGPEDTKGRPVDPPEDESEDLDFDDPSVPIDPPENQGGGGY